MAYTVSEAAKQIGKSASWVRGKCDKGEIAAAKVYDADQKREVWMVDDSEVERIRLEQLGKMNLTQDVETGALAPVPVETEDPKFLMVKEMYNAARTHYEDAVEYQRQQIEELQVRNGVLLRENGELHGIIEGKNDAIVRLERRVLELQVELKAERRKSFLQKLLGVKENETEYPG